MKSLKYLITFAATVAALTLSASATFIVADNPGGAKLFIDVANKDASAFKGFVGKNNASAPNVDISTTGNVDTGSGFANIKPIKDGSLTELIFTPVDPNLFADFSFRGQLNDGANGTVTLVVQDNQGGAPQTFMFTGLGGPNDFARQGIISLDGETIQSITLTSDFKEVKQIEFSFAPGAQVPDGGMTVALLGGSLAVVEVLRRKFAKRA
ncbi:MAG: VPDSG-CTERM sorting domain-containing protein [Chthoniobacterales bacterium]|nr:VPDSG-CTERM sorting domain-containing protein [Chthoniobacterales bacterium]